MLVKVLFKGEIIVLRDINEFIRDLDYVGLIF